MELAVTKDVGGFSLGPERPAQGPRVPGMEMGPARHPGFPWSVRFGIPVARLIPGSGMIDAPTTASRCDLAIGRPGSRLGHRAVRKPQPLDVELDCIMHLDLNVLPGAPSSHATRQVRRIGREARRGLLDDDEISADFSPDCFPMLFWVPGARSAPGLPGTVTTPGRAACVSWRWLHACGPDTNPPPQSY